MAHWYHTEVRWTEAVPSARDCAGLAELLRQLDRDTGPDPWGGEWGEGLRVIRKKETKPRKQSQHRCRRCGIAGHNRRSCTSKVKVRWIRSKHDGRIRMDRSERTAA